MSLNALSTVKLVVSGIVGIGAGRITKSIITNNMTADSIVDKVSMVVGAWAIGGMVGTASKDYTDKTIDEVWAVGVKISDRWRLNEKLNRINRMESTFEKEGLNPTDFYLENGKYVPVKKDDEDEVAMQTKQNLDENNNPVN